MHRHQVRFLFLNLGHFMDDLFMLIFASVAALRLSTEWGFSTLFGLLAAAALLVFVAVLLLPKSEKAIQRRSPSTA